jgi:hypothetical protein
VLLLLAIATALAACASGQGPDIETNPILGPGPSLPSVNGVPIGGAIW